MVKFWICRCGCAVLCWCRSGRREKEESVLIGLKMIVGRDVRVGEGGEIGGEIGVVQVMQVSKMGK